MCSKISNDIITKICYRSCDDDDNDDDDDNNNNNSNEMKLGKF
jgi:hypothetical protein